MPVATARIGLACLLMVASTVVWRRGEVFAGSVDPVVLGKALCALLALVLAFIAAQTAGADRQRLGTGTLWLLGIVLVGSVLGALEHGTLVASAVAAARVAVLGATVFFLSRAAPALQVLRAAVASCGLVAAFAAATGIPSLLGGRFFGGIPPLHPNGLALLAGVVVLWAAWRTVLGEARWRHALLGGGYLAVVWLTGSRTGLLMLALALVVMALHLRRPRVGLVVGGLVAVAVGSVVVVATGAVGGFVERDGVGTSTLESRFIAWSAAQSWAESWWQWVFGGGLSVKYIPVEGQWWDEQLLDSSWVSALVQAGLLGLATAGTWAMWTGLGALRAPRPHRVLCLGLLTFLLGRSLLESGLFDATPEFLLFIAVSLLVERGSRADLQEDLVAGPVESDRRARSVGRAAERSAPRAGSVVGSAGSVSGAD
ncbi:hypothetical protein [Blastococcus saxobsidens]|uniref:O-antigen ligase family protein n=1 Tax=Blastococcus saxobsidens (strain DD2) TaxID=1146883 RepID=H6RSH8_BLASD|nr:hypothetical protein [Blastococcus saxobsidens]CCG01729.1 conserved membrane protein of unknown function [Blastococcus saxobsidens DD2]